jgi:hypothetical protein
MTKPTASNPGKDTSDESTSQTQTPGTDSRSENERRDWPGKSEPGHIRPIGPAYRSGSDGSANTRNNS